VCLLFTISLFCSWLTNQQSLWLLANDKESQRKLREELSPIMAENPRPDYRTLKDLKWLDCVVYVSLRLLFLIIPHSTVRTSMESLRVMPPVPLTVRIAHEQGVLDGVVIPKGTMFYIPVHIPIYPRIQNSCGR